MSIHPNGYILPDKKPMWNINSPQHKEDKDMKADDVQIGGNHYLEMGVEPWNVIDCWSTEQRIGFYRGNALKYVMRMGTKDENVKEIRKAIHYLNKLSEVLEDFDRAREADRS